MEYLRRDNRFRPAPVTVVWNARPGRLTLCLLGAAILLPLAAVVWLLLRQPSNPSNETISPEIAALDIQSLRKQVGLAERRIQKLQERQSHLFPSGPAIVIDSAANQLYLFQGSRVVIQDKCSTGS